MLKRKENTMYLLILGAKERVADEQPPPGHNFYRAITTPYDSLRTSYQVENRHNVISPLPGRRYITSGRVVTFFSLTACPRCMVWFLTLRPRGGAGLSTSDWVMSRCRHCCGDRRSRTIFVQKYVRYLTRPLPMCTDSSASWSF